MRLSRPFVYRQRLQRSLLGSGKGFLRRYDRTLCQPVIALGYSCPSGHEGRIIGQHLLEAIISEFQRLGCSSVQVLETFQVQTTHPPALNKRTLYRAITMTLLVSFRWFLSF